MNIEDIKQNAEITSTSVCGRHFNRVTITYDEFDYLVTLTGRENSYKKIGADFVEMDYHDEFVPLIEHAEIVKEQEEIRSWKVYEGQSYEDFVNNILVMEKIRLEKLQKETEPIIGSTFSGKTIQHILRNNSF